jgi:hypothetical protein
MTIIARVRVQSVQDNMQGDNTKWSENIRLSAVYSNDKNSPNYSFSEATPYADFTMSISNPGAFGFFVEGKEYDLTFTPAPNNS